MTTAGNSYFSNVSVPTPTVELCKDPAKLADLLSKMQLRLNTELRRFRVVKCPNIRQQYNDETAGTRVSVPNPGFQVGAVFFSHAVATKTGDGQTQPATQTAPGYLRDIIIQTSGGVSFLPIVPNDITNVFIGEYTTTFDVFVVLMEGEGTVR